MTGPRCRRKHRPSGRQGQSGARASKHPTPETGWTARRGSVAAGGGTEGQDLPSQFKLRNPAAPGEAHPERGEVPHRTDRGTGTEQSGGRPTGFGVGLGLAEPRAVPRTRCWWRRGVGQRRSLPGEEPLGSQRSRNARAWAGLPGSEAGKGCAFAQGPGRPGAGSPGAQTPSGRDPLRSRACGPGGVGVGGGAGRAEAWKGRGGAWGGPAAASSSPRRTGAGGGGGGDSGGAGTRRAPAPLPPQPKSKLQPAPGRGHGSPALPGS